MSVETADYCTVSPHGEILSSKTTESISREIVRTPSTNVFMCEKCGACCFECRYLSGKVGENPSCSLGEDKPELCQSKEWRPGSPNCVKSRLVVFGLRDEKPKPEAVSFPVGSIV